jgi:hypothetical protein
MRILVMIKLPNINDNVNVQLLVLPPGTEVLKDAPRWRPFLVQNLSLQCDSEHYFDCAIQASISQCSLPKSSVAAILSLSSAILARFSDRSRPCHAVEPLRPE